MSAYVLVELTVIDADVMADYRQLALPAVQQHGGRFVARSSEPEQLEGDRPVGEQVVVIEFDSMEAARNWYSSGAYAHALAVRDRAMTRRMTLVGQPE